METIAREELLSFGQALVLMANADHRMTRDEQIAVTRAILDIGLSVDDAEALWKSTPDEPSVLDAIRRWTSPVLRRVLLKQLFIVAYADGEYSPEERAVLDRIFGALALDPSVRDAMESWVQRGIAWQREGIELCIPPDAPA
jgi:uncharacterized tellurite resistance protein B-like protein